MRIVAPPTRSARPKTLTADELGRLVAATPVDQRELVAFVVNTGCRISEALSMRWRNFATIGGAPIVRFDRSKTVAGLAPIALPPSTARMLTARRAAIGAQSDDLVFPNAAGREHDRRSWTRRVFKPAAAGAGIPWASPHMLRHSLATRLADRGETAERIGSRPCCVTPTTGAPPASSTSAPRSWTRLTSRSASWGTRWGTSPPSTSPIRP